MQCAPNQMEPLVACSEVSAVSGSQGIPKPTGLSLLFAVPLCHPVPCAELSRKTHTSFKNIILWTGEFLRNLQHKGKWTYYTCNSSEVGRESNMALVVVQCPLYSCSCAFHGVQFSVYDCFSSLFPFILCFYNSDKLLKVIILSPK